MSFLHAPASWPPVLVYGGSMAALWTYVATLYVANRLRSGRQAWAKRWIYFTEIAIGAVCSYGVGWLLLRYLVR